MFLSELQANIEYDPKLQQQVPKEELERIKMENILLEYQIREGLSQLKADEAKVMLWNAMNALTKARIEQYGYIPDPDPWSDSNER